MEGFNLPWGFASPEFAEFGYFTLLFRRERQRNENQFITRTQSIDKKKQINKHFLPNSRHVRLSFTVRRCRRGLR